MCECELSFREVVQRVVRVTTGRNDRYTWSRLSRNASCFDWCVALIALTFFVRVRVLRYFHPLVLFFSSGDERGLLAVKVMSIWLCQWNMPWPSNTYTLLFLERTAVCIFSPLEQHSRRLALVRLTMAWHCGHSCSFNHVFNFSNAGKYTWKYSRHFDHLNLWAQT